MYDEKLIEDSLAFAEEIKAMLEGQKEAGLKSPLSSPSFSEPQQPLSQETARVQAQAMPRQPQVSSQQSPVPQPTRQAAPAQPASTRPSQLNPAGAQPTQQATARPQQPARQPIPQAVQPQQVPARPQQPAQQMIQPQQAPVRPQQPTQQQMVQPQQRPQQPVQQAAQPQQTPMRPPQPTQQTTQPQATPVRPQQPVQQPMQQMARPQQPVQPQQRPQQPVQPQQAPARPQQPVQQPMQQAVQPQQAPVRPQQPVQQMARPQQPAQPQAAPARSQQPVQPQQAPARPQQPVQQPMQQTVRPQQPVQQPMQQTVRSQQTVQPQQAPASPQQPMQQAAQPQQAPARSQQPVQQMVQPQQAMQSQQVSQPVQQLGQMAQPQQAQYQPVQTVSQQQGTENPTGADGDRHTYEITIKFDMGGIKKKFGKLKEKLAPETRTIEDVNAAMEVNRQLQAERQNQDPKTLAENGAAVVEKAAGAAEKAAGAVKKLPNMLKKQPVPVEGEAFYDGSGNSMDAQVVQLEGEAVEENGFMAKLQDVKEGIPQKASQASHLVTNLVILAFCIAIAYCLAAFVTTYIAHPSPVEGESMEPTLSDGDTVIIQRLTYYFNDPERFDVIVFPVNYEDGGDQETYYIKRVIGLPGETVQIIDGSVYINGSKLTSDKYALSDIMEAGIAEKELVLGENQYFVMGDNRNMSTDSRNSYVGLVNKNDIVGEAWICTWPLRHFGSLKR